MKDILQNTQKIVDKSKIVAIVPAAGNGSRMHCDIPKQYLKIESKTIIEYTLQKLLTHPQIDHIIVAINAQDAIFNTLPIAKNRRITVVTGGLTRADSVLAGLQQVDDNDWALVHDAARPCVQQTDITALITAVLSTQQGGILATKVSDTIKRAYPHDACIECSEDRTYLWAAATPQLFNAGQLKRCLLSAAQNGITVTDEASAIEYGGGHPLLVECRRDNIKITKPEDLALATFYLKTVS
ncbi:2-C-methyl-D-erythritol 4-phosphate cytidylyltransferase [Orbaceae bacterium ESL0727]|nr:2-C-methyl-D-erythritol 4-phosphate cytidylyltransferase [Orbaceae bacterium ESL0727]